MTETNPNAQQDGVKAFLLHHLFLIIVALIVIAVIGWLAVSKGMAVRQAEQAAAAERATLVQKSAARQAETVRQSLHLFTVPLAWAIRREMMSGNLDQVDQYVIDLVNQPGFERVVVAKADGLVAVASDRKHIGAPFGSLYDERHLGAEQIAVEEAARGGWLIVVPIMGLTARLGTVAIDYRAPPLSLEE
jgi:sensor histidine kinase regulating citrate/malate metabolism